MSKVSVFASSSYGMRETLNDIQDSIRISGDAKTSSAFNFLNTPSVLDGSTKLHVAEIEVPLSDQMTNILVTRGHVVSPGSICSDKHSARIALGPDFEHGSIVPSSNAYGCDI